MDKKFFTKDNLMCVFATMIIVFAYGAQRIIEVTLSPDKSLALILAIVYTILLAVVLYLISKSNNLFFGILAALIGYKMMPPPVSFLSQTTIDGKTLYFLVGKAAAVLFVVVVYKLYKAQSEPHEIRSLPLLTIMLSVPFFGEISQEISRYLYSKTGDMLPVYFSQYACYAAAVAVILAIAYISGYSSLRFTAYFEYTALTINILRQIGKIAYFAIAKEHISKSNYLWIVLYIALMVCFAIALKKEEKEKA